MGFVKYRIFTVASFLSGRFGVTLWVGWLIKVPLNALEDVSVQHILLRPVAVRGSDEVL